MPAATTSDQLFVHLRKSGLISSSHLEVLLDRVQPGERPDSVLERFVREGLLTPFQAERIGAGKYKGFVLGGYVILDRIGGGGMGQVFLAEHTAMRRLVAVKVLAPAGGTESIARERFLREARAAATLDHPNIIRVFDLRQDRQILYMAMAYVEGVSLQQLVVRGGRLEIPAAANYVRQVAHGLQHAHENGLVHRDIKPANLLLARDGTVLVLDLGLVRSEADANSQLTSRLDRTILGTADYLAPEQAMDSSSVDIRADVYSLGATLYYLLAGRTLFPDGRTAQKLMWQQLKAPTPIRDLRPDVPEGLAAVLNQALQKSPGDRFQSPAAFADALAPWASAVAQPPDPDLLPASPPRWSGSALPIGTGSVASMSCAVIDLPPAPWERRSQVLTSTLDERDQATPLQVPLPLSRTPLLIPQSEERPLVPSPEPESLQLFAFLAAGFALIAVGFGFAVLVLWLAGWLIA